MGVIRLTFAGVTPPPEGECRLLILPPSSRVEEDRPDEYRHLAAGQGAWLVTPPCRRDGYVCQSLLNGAGEVVLTQRAVYLHESLRGDFRRGGRLETADTPWGRTALLPDACIYHPESARAAALLGVRLIVAGVWLDEAGEDRLYFGPWSSAQANCLYVAFSGGAFSAVLGPCNVTRDRGCTGVMAGPSAGDIDCRLDMGELDRAHAVFPVLDTMNPRLYRSHEKELAR